MRVWPGTPYPLGATWDGEGVNFAIFTENQASNFAVPIQYAIALLEHSGWKAPPPKDAKEPENSASP